MYQPIDLSLVHSVNTYLKCKGLCQLICARKEGMHTDTHALQCTHTHSHTHSLSVSLSPDLVVTPTFYWRETISEGHRGMSAKIWI